MRCILRIRLRASTCARACKACQHALARVDARIHKQSRGDASNAKRSGSGPAPPRAHTRSCRFSSYIRTLANTHSYAHALTARHANTDSKRMLPQARDGNEHLNAT
jgi:hypothetical protein